MQRALSVIFNLMTGLLVGNGEGIGTSAEALTPCFSSRYAVLTQSVLFAAGADHQVWRVFTEWCT